MLATHSYYRKCFPFLSAPLFWHLEHNRFLIVQSPVIGEKLLKSKATRLLPILNSSYLGSAGSFTSVTVSCSCWIIDRVLQDLDWGCSSLRFMVNFKAGTDLWMMQFYIFSSSGSNRLLYG